jgi:hypothetical protein
VTVLGKDNCPSNSLPIEQTAASIQVTPGHTYELRIVDGCIGYGDYYGTPLYGTQLQVHYRMGGYDMRTTVGWGSYLQTGGQPGEALADNRIFPDCDSAKEFGYAAPYNPVTVTSDGSVIYFQANDQGCGVCGDNWGSEIVVVTDLSGR